MDVQTVESDLKKRPIPRWLAREQESGRIYNWATIASAAVLLGMLVFSYVILTREAAPGSMLSPTQIALLRECLEVQGYGFIETGWTRSELMSPTIDLAKSSNTLNRLTFVLLYATDFADRLEKEIIPALKAGFIVLSDRYIYTAMARAGVRGVDRTWIRNLYGFAIVPHLVFYLRIDEKTLIRRVLQSRGMDFWESGMDLKLGDDIYESFRAYQRSLLKEYTSMADEYNFRVLDARRKVEVIQEELRRQIGAFLAESDAGAPAAT